MDMVTAAAVVVITAFNVSGERLESHEYQMGYQPAVIEYLMTDSNLLTDDTIEICDDGWCERQQVTDMMEWAYERHGVIVDYGDD